VAVEPRGGGKESGNSQKKGIHSETPRPKRPPKHKTGKLNRRNAGTGEFLGADFEKGEPGAQILQRKKKEQKKNLVCSMVFRTSGGGSSCREIGRSTRTRPKAEITKKTGEIM